MSRRQWRTEGGQRGRFAPGGTLPGGGKKGKKEKEKKRKRKEGKKEKGKKREQENMEEAKVNLSDSKTEMEHLSCGARCTHNLANV